MVHWTAAARGAGGDGVAKKEPRPLELGFLQIGALEDLIEQNHRNAAHAVRLDIPFSIEDRPAESKVAAEGCRHSPRSPVHATTVQKSVITAAGAGGGGGMAGNSPDETSQG